MPDEQPKIEPGAVVLIEATVERVQDNGTLIVKMANGAFNVFKPEQVTKKP